MARKQLVTAAIRVLRKAGVEYLEHHYEYSAGSGALGGAEQLHLVPHQVIKTLILEDSTGRPLCMLMHGDREVSLKKLARTIGVKAIMMAPPTKAERWSGYQVGGTSPFGLRTSMPAYCEAGVAKYESIVINGGKRGFLIELAFADVADLLELNMVAVAL